MAVTLNLMRLLIPSSRLAVHASDVELCALKDSHLTSTFVTLSSVYGPSTVMRNLLATLSLHPSGIGMSTMRVAYIMICIQKIGGGLYRYVYCFELVAVILSVVSGGA